MTSACSDRPRHDAVRAAGRKDGPAVARLLGDLHSDIAAERVGERIACLAATGADPVFVAADGDWITGVLALHTALMLHHAGRVARITALAVAADARRHGIGRLLVEHAAAFAERQGCAMLELTTGLERSAAQAFYRALGFEATSFRFRRWLTARGDMAPASSRR